MDTNLSLTDLQVYQPVPGVTYWYGASISSSGQFMVIGNDTNTNLYYNNNYGNMNDWSLIDTLFVNVSTAISSDGRYSISTASNGTGIYVNTNYGDPAYGISYATPYNCIGNNSVAMSSTGQYIVIALYDTNDTNALGTNGLFNMYYYSENYGFNWTLNSNSYPNIAPLYAVLKFTSVAMSSSGQNIAFIGNDYISTTQNFVVYGNNYGDPLNMNIIYDISGNTHPISSYVISMNSAGNIIAFCPYFTTGYVYVGTQNGSSWVFQDSRQTSLNSTSYIWRSITMSSSGQYMAICAYDDISGGEIAGKGILYSSNYGLSWYQLFDQPNYSNWGTIALNSSGQKMIVGQDFTDGVVVTGTISLTNLPPILIPSSSSSSNSILQNYNNTILPNSYINVISPTNNNGGGGTINILNLTNGYATNITFNSVYISGNIINIPLNQIQILQYFNNTSNPPSSLQDPSINIYFSYINGILSIYSSGGVLLNIEVIGSFTYQLPQTISLTSGPPGPPPVPPSTKIT
jgi:hypothetical protein